MLELNKTTSWMGGKILSSNQGFFYGIGSDTRKDLTGKLFFALRGGTFDAHDFLDKAVNHGAAGLVVDNKDKLELLNESNLNISIILVDDTLKALQSLAHQYRKEMQAKIIAITGSNGKTTSKEFTAQVLSPFFKTHYNQGSFNNHWGVPFSLLDIKEDHQVAIIEMGMNHAHELEKLVKIADPDIVICTMVGNAHIEHFGVIEKIAEAKQEIYEFSKADSIKIFNLDNSHTLKMFQKFGIDKNKCFTFSENNKHAHVFLKVEEFNIEKLRISGLIGGVSNVIEVPVFGHQNITNIMAAATIALSVGVGPNQIWSALTGLKTNWGRNQFVNSDGGSKILFDGYNANLDSMESLLQNFSLLKPKGKKIAVLAEMLEVGTLSDDFHRKIGKLAAESGFDLIFFYGKPWNAVVDGIKSANRAVEHFCYPEFTPEIITKIKQVENSLDIICIKGSRGMATEKIVKGLVNTFPSK